MRGQCNSNRGQELIIDISTTYRAGSRFLIVELKDRLCKDGQIDPKALELFQGLGAWIKDNGDSIYGTHPNPLPARPVWGDANVSNDGKTLYLHVMEWPKDGKLFVEALILPRKSVRGFVKESSENGRNAKQVCAAI